MLSDGSLIPKRSGTCVFISCSNVVTGGHEVHPGRIFSPPSLDIFELHDAEIRVENLRYRKRCRPFYNGLA
jgi:hypothetical protein